MAEIEIDLDSAKRNKIIGIFVSVFFHALLLVLFLFLGLSYQEPPPPEYGIEVDMGGGGGGGSSGGRSRNDDAAMVPASPTNTANENLATQNIEETTEISTTKNPSDKPKPTPTNTATEQKSTVETPTINPNALFTKKTDQGSAGSGGSGTSSGQGTGTGTGSGSGIGEGEGSGQGKGIGSGTGTSGGDFFLKGRPVVRKAHPPKGKNIEGKVVVDFSADRTGKVTSVRIGRGTTINDERIWEECKKAALESEFKAKSDAEIEERGTITYYYVIQ